MGTVGRGQGRGRSTVEPAYGGCRTPSISNGAAPLAAPAACEASSPPQPTTANSLLTPTAMTMPSTRAAIEVR